MKTYKKILAVLIVGIVGIFIAGTQITSAETTNDFSMGYWNGQQQASQDGPIQQCLLVKSDVEERAQDKADMHLNSMKDDDNSDSYVKGFRAGYENIFLSYYRDSCRG